MPALPPALQPLDVQMCAGEIHLVPTQGHQLADPKPVAKRDKDHGSVAMPPAPAFARGPDQMLDLAFGQILTRPNLGILVPSRRRVPPHDCSIFSCSGC